MQPSQDTIAHLDHLWKSYGGVPVLKDVSLSLKRGDIHAVVGGNGAGKSTIMKILTGVITPESGTITVDGTTVKGFTPRTAHQHHIYMVPQEPQLFPHLSVQENITLSLGDIKVDSQTFTNVCNSLAPHLSLKEPASNLSISDQQLVEIIRGMLRDTSVLIVDEPTAALTAKETASLFVHLKRLASEGVGIFYVSHRMHEIFEICDRVTVLRDGAIVFHKPTSETNVGELVQHMIPDSAMARSAKAPASSDATEPVPSAVPAAAPSDAPSDTPAAAPSAPQATATSATPAATPSASTIDVSTPSLSVERLTGQGFSDITFHVYPGEIVGIVGVVGSGRTELAESLYGTRDAKGSVTLLGQPYNQRSPRTSLQRGLSYIPEDRHLNGVFLAGSIIDNTTSTVLGDMATAGWLHPKRERAFVQALTDRLDLQKGGLHRKVSNLSGGNQQKVSLAKALAPNPKVVMLDEPSRGVDVGARADLYRLIASLRKEGCAVMVISSDFEEIVEISTRVLVMRAGHIMHEIHNEDINLALIRDCSFGLLRPDQYPHQPQSVPSSLEYIR